MAATAFQTVRIIAVFVFLELTLPALNYITDINVYRHARDDMHSAERHEPVALVSNFSDPFYGCQCQCVSRTPTLLAPLVANNHVCVGAYSPPDGRMCSLLRSAQFQPGKTCDVYAVTRLVIFDSQTASSANGTYDTMSPGTCIMAVSFESAHDRLRSGASDIDLISKAMLGILVISGVANAVALFLRGRWALVDLRKGTEGAAHRRIEVEYALHVLQDGPQLVLALLYLSRTGAALGTECLECIVGPPLAMLGGLLGVGRSECTYQSTPADNMAVLLSIIASGVVIFKTCVVLAVRQVKSSRAVGADPCMWTLAGLVLHSTFLLGPICGVLYFDDSLSHMFGINTSGRHALLAITIVSIFVHAVIIAKLLFALITCQAPDTCVAAPNSAPGSQEDLPVGTFVAIDSVQGPPSPPRSRNAEDAEDNMHAFMARYGRAGQLQNAQNEKDARTKQRMELASV